MQLILYVIIGFLAQMIDGTLGMAYGVSCRTFLRAFTNVPPEIISALIHYAEIPTTFASMISHIKYKNIDKRIFVNLFYTGVLGSIIGAYIITLNFNLIEIIVDIFLIIMGVVVFFKGLNKKNNSKFLNNKYCIRFLGLVGGLFDAVGGGGWGPIVTGSLLSTHGTPKKIIGTVNSIEFFVTISSSITFLLLITNIKKYLIIILGLVIGGVVASPLAVKLCQKIEERKLYFAVGIMLILVNIYNIIMIFM